MTYLDDVRGKGLLSNAWFNAVLFLLVTLLLYTSDLRGTGLAKLLAPAIDNNVDAGGGARIILAAFFGALFVGNFHLIGFFKFRNRIIVVWLELLGLFIAFVYAFDLDFEFIGRKVGFMITQGAFTTLYISAVSISIAFVIALIGAIAKLSNNAVAFGLASFYTSFFRGLPLLIQVYLLYLGLPQMGFMVGAVPAGIIALSLCFGAYMTEIFRAGIQSIDKGQWEASRSLAFTNYQTMRYIILPQAIRIIIPPTGNTFIAMLKDSSLVSVLGVWELMFLARTQGQTEFKHMEMLITAAIIYWILSIILEFIQSKIERKFRKAE